MARPRFSEMLVNRRRQLGLSVKQASSVLRLKEEVLIAFEEGDFEAMPKSGYAQGMLSSYARYLGMNSREVINQFTSDLREWERQAASGRARRTRASRRDEPVYELPGDVASRRASYQGSKGLLPTSGGFAGDLTTYSTVSSPRPKNSRPSPLVNYRQSMQSASDGAGYGQGYQQGGYGQPDGGYGRANGYAGAAQGGFGRGYDEDRRYTGRDVPARSGRRRTQQQGRYRRQPDEYGNAARYTGREGRAERAARDSVMTQDVSGQYVDDLRYDDARPYEAASTRSGRQSSRNIANMQRPNVRRRPPQRGRGSRQQRDSRRRAPRHGGVLGVVEAFFSDGRRAAAFALVVAALIITVVIISSVSSCVRNQGTATEKTVAVSTSSSSESKKKSSSKTSTEKKEAEEAAAAAAAEKKAKAEKEANTETKVTVSVADGEVSWVEIEVDGKSDVAEQVTGPWKKTYTVTDSITIQVSNPLEDRGRWVDHDPGYEGHQDGRQLRLGRRGVRGRPDDGLDNGDVGWGVCKRAVDGRGKRYNHGRRDDVHPDERRHDERDHRNRNKPEWADGSDDGQRITLVLPSGLAAKPRLSARARREMRHGQGIKLRRGVER